MGRWIAVRATAFGLNRGIPPSELLRQLGRAFPHREPAWRWAVLADAQARRAPS